MNHQSPLHLPHRMREVALKRLLRGMGADAVQYYMVVRTADMVLRIHGIRGVSANPAAAARWATGDGLAFVVSEADPDQVAPLNRFTQPPQDAMSLAMIRYAFKDVGYNEIYYNNVSAGADHRGLVAFTRAQAGPWEIDPSVLAATTRAVNKTFRAAWQEELKLAPPDGTLELTRDGEVSGTPAVVAWAQKHGVRRWGGAQVASTPLGASPLSWAPAAFAQVVALHDGGQVITIQRVTPMVLPPVMSDLTDVLRRVASLAAVGMTVAEIAKELDRSPDTIRESLARIYEKLGISSRAELAAAARRMLI